MNAPLESTLHVCQESTHHVLKLGQDCVEQTLEFSNENPITINDNSAATPYPSEIVVSGFNASAYVLHLTCSINGFSHTYPGDVVIVLESTSGAAVMLDGEVGGGTGANETNLVFDDSSQNNLVPSVSGTYKPTGTNGELTGDGPASPYRTTLSGLYGINPNGTWKLWVIDAANGDSGLISNGWSLEITNGCGTVFWNTRQCATASCPIPYSDISVEKCIEAGTVFSIVSQQDADDQALASAQSEADDELECPELTLANSLNFGVRKIIYYHSILYDPSNVSAPALLIAGDAVGAVTWDIISGSIPSGMSLSQSGQFSGTPDEQFVFEDCNGTGVSVPEVAKHYNFTVRATDSVGTTGTQDIDFPVVLGGRVQLTYTIPPGSVLNPTYTPLPTPYDDIGIVFNYFDGAMFYMPLRGVDGTFGGIFWGGPAFSHDTAAASGFGMARQLDGTWIPTLSIWVEFAVEGWAGWMVYQGVAGSIYRTGETIPISGYVRHDGGPNTPPPSIAGSCTLTIT